MTKKFYITTAIDYPNGVPHMGHAYEKVVTDFYNRFYKLLGWQTYFVTGTDENGQKLQESAKSANMKTQDFVNSNVQIFRDFAEVLNISNDDFIRTTESRHQKTAKEFWNKLEKKGDLYFGTYSGQYCLSCENFYTELQAPEGVCPHHHNELTLKEEDGYFFKISNYEEWIISYIKSSPDFILPENAKKELLSRLEKEPLKDVAFSRPNNGWGIDVPGNKDYVMYTWCDALVNYYSALEDKGLTDEYWPCNMHVIGKDIVWFHGVIWPCMLKAIGIELPKQIYVHGMILGSDGRKMSKSLGNGVDPFEILKKYPLDSFRYYLLRNIPSSNDGAFIEKELVDKHNNELGNDLGNLLMRVAKLYLKQSEEKLKPGKQELFPENCLSEVIEHVESRNHNKAIDKLWESVNRCNQYINESKPWDEISNPERFNEIIYNCIYTIDYCSQLLWPVMPTISKKIIDSIGTKLITNIHSLKYGNDYRLTSPDVLFEKIEYKKEIYIFNINSDLELVKTIENQLTKFKITTISIKDTDQLISNLENNIIPNLVISTGDSIDFTNILLEKRLKTPELIINNNASKDHYKLYKKMKFIKVCYDENDMEQNIKILLKRVN